jgi:trimeric autotransporter adhesin
MMFASYPRYIRLALAVLLTMCGVSAVEAQTTNTAFGLDALADIRSGLGNSAFGEEAMHLTTLGSENTAVGALALIRNNGDSNTATGANALEYNTTGNENAAFGVNSLAFNTTGTSNSAVGMISMYYNTSGSYNTAAGYLALNGNTIGNYNTGAGYAALRNNTTGTKNAAVGGSALYNNSTGNFNEALGSQALFGNTTGSNNIGIGLQAGYYPKTGSNNIEIGAAGATSDTAVIRIGTQSTQKATYIAGIRGVNVTGGVPVIVNANGQLGIVSSSRRYKQDIRSMGDTSDRLLRLRPVIFRYKLPDEQGQKPEQYGLIAEEVAQVMPELVVYNEKGQPETVAYQTLTPLLLNELQREHALIVKMQSQIDELRRAHK